MSKFVAPLFEAMPYYMTAMGMQGARFLEGNDGTGAGGTPPAGTGTPPEGTGTPPEGTPAGGNPADGDGEGEGELGEAGKRALEAERNARKQADKDKAEVEATAATAATESAAEIATLTGTVAEREATISARDARISVLELALAHGVTEKDDLDLLASVTDADKRASLAQRLSGKALQSAPVPKSGTRDDDLNPSGGSLAAGREMFANSKTKKVGA